MRFPVSTLKSPLKGGRESENEASGPVARRETGGVEDSSVVDFAMEPWHQKPVCSPRSVLRRTVGLLCAAQCLGVLVSVAAPAAVVVDQQWRAIVVPAGVLGCLRGADTATVSAVSCSPRCAPIPWQFDERNEAGELVLDRGPGRSIDADGGLVDDNDEISLMWSDAGARVAQPWTTKVLCVDEMRVRVGDEERWVYFARHRSKAPRSTRRYVQYDPAADVMRGDAIDLTFAGATPRGLALRRGAAAGRDLLDRLKIRAYARFFGIFPLRRDEEDIRSVYEAWRVGAVRVLRRERKWVELAFGFRTPYLITETAFYRNFSILPVRLRLNFPPAKLLSGIEIRAALDFLDLRGWRVWAPGLAAPVVVGGGGVSALADLPVGVPSLVTLQGADSTFALVLRLGPTLESVGKRHYYNEVTSLDAPEDQAGEMPGLGFRLVEWGEVDAGWHWFAAESYALPAGYDPSAFADELQIKPEVDVVSRWRDRSLGH